MNLSDYNILRVAKARYKWDDILYNNCTLDFRVIGGIVRVDGVVKDEFTYDYLWKTISEIYGINAISLNVKILEPEHAINMSDKTMANIIYKRLKYESEIDEKDLVVNVAKGNVTIAGKVKSKLDKFLANSIIKSSAKPKSIHNYLAVDS